jgi:hypothetical protein
MYTVEVTTGGEFTAHSTHSSYRDAVDQADMVRGRVVPEANVRLTIIEIDQTIVDCKLCDFEAPNEFLRDLVEQAKEEGTATMHDDAGCPVTATITAE